METLGKSVPQRSLSFQVCKMVAAPQDSYGNAMKSDLSRAEPHVWNRVGTVNWGCCYFNCQGGVGWDGTGAKKAAVGRAHVAMPTSAQNDGHQEAQE